MRVSLCAIPLFTLTLIACGEIFAQDQAPPYLEKYKRGLPSLGSTIEFEDDHSLPPKLKGRKVTNTPLNVRADPFLLTDETITSLRQAAVLNSKVKQALGQRHVFLTVGRTEQEKETRPQAGKPLTTLRFYSYSRNLAYDVHMADKEVVRIAPKRKGYQPPESPEEVKAAAEIVQKDARFKEDVAGLFARGIWTPSKDGNRHLYLLFYKGQGLERGPAVFEAEVDMTARRVVSARRVRH